jgi:hypothetical protein
LELSAHRQVSPYFGISRRLADSLNRPDVITANNGSAKEGAMKRPVIIQWLIRRPLAAVILAAVSRRLQSAFAADSPKSAADPAVGRIH